jgi:hypothetical protein
VCDPKAIERRIPYEEFLEKSVGFINPTNVTHLCSELGLEPDAASLMESLDGESFYVCSSTLKKYGKKAYNYSKVFKLNPGGVGVEARVLFCCDLVTPHGSVML